MASKRNGKQTENQPASEAPSASEGLERNAKIPKRVSRQAADVAPSGDRPAHHMTKSQFARSFGLSLDAIAAWILKDGMPVLYKPQSTGEEYIIDGNAALFWLIENKQIKGGKLWPKDNKTFTPSGSKDDTPLEQMSWAARGERARAISDEADADRKLKQTVYVDEIVPPIVELLLQTRSALLDLPGRKAMSYEGLPGPEIQAMMETDIDEALGKLSEGYLVDNVFRDADAIIEGSKRAQDEG